MKIVIIENTDKDFFISRIRLANFLKQKGYYITVIVPNGIFINEIKDAGFEVFVVGKNIRGRGVLNKIQFALDMYKILKNNDFDVVHCFRMQPNIIGGFIAGVLGQKNVINHITGLGILFTKTSLKYRIQKQFVKFCYQFNNRIFNTKYIFQNNDDVIELGINQNFTIVRGSAVNEEIFFSKKNGKSIYFQKSKYETQKKISVLFASRLLKSKGLDILVKALKLANNSVNNNFQLLVAGWIDEQNLDSYNRDDIELFKQNDFVHFLGDRQDISDLINTSDICALPTSYREGTPRFLLEAMACSKPIITTNVPGCNHLIDKKNENGILIEKNDFLALTKALIRLSNKNLINMGNNSLRLYKKKFSEEIVYNAIFNFYQTK